MNIMMLIMNLFPIQLIWRAISTIQIIKVYKYKRIVFCSFLYLFNLGTISAVNDFSSDELNRESSKKIRCLQDDNNFVNVQHNLTSISANKPIFNWNLLRKQIFGLTNKDNTTCYINAALQCLASTPPLVDWLFDQIDKLNTCKK